MTKTSALSTRSPNAIRVGEDVLDDELLELHQAQNASTALYPECHLSAACGTEGWDDHAGYGTVPAGGGYAASALAIVATGSAVDEVITDLWITPDRAIGELECAIEAMCAAGNTVRAVFSLTGSVGVATATVDADDSHNGDERMQPLDVSAATEGGEWCMLVVTFQRLAGAAGNNEMRTIRVEELPLATLLDPTDD